jgi:hypothetical protein
MSRSFRHKPFVAICGNGSAQWDKTHAARGVRRAHRRELHKVLTTGEFDVFLPHKYECAGNETYSWGRDGNQRWCGLSKRDWNTHVEACIFSDSIWFGDEDYTAWPPVWYTHMMYK